MRQVLQAAITCIYTVTVWLVCYCNRVPAWGSPGQMRREEGDLNYQGWHSVREPVGMSQVIFYSVCYQEL